MFRVTDGGGQTDAPGIHPRQSAQPLNEAQGLPAPVAAQQGMHLVNHHKPQVMKQPGNGGVLVQQHGFQAFRGDLQNAGGVLHHFGLVALRHVPMPVPHGNVPLGAQLIEPPELVVDQGFQGADVDCPHRSRGIFGKQGNDGEKGRFRLAGGSGGGEQQIVIGIEDGIRRRHLNGTEILPAVAVDIILHKGRIAVKGVTHRQLQSLTVMVQTDFAGGSLNGMRPPVFASPL